MAKSSARKKREHLVRQGKWNPLSDRGSWFGINPTTKSTPTMKTKKEKVYKKHKVFGNSDYQMPCVF
jgi:hypothetical protein